MVDRASAACTCSSGICATHLQLQSSAELTSSLSRWKDCLGDDLRLAAELGKILLDRNKLLEDELDDVRSNCWEKDVQLEVLRKQVADLRDLNNTKDALLLEAESYGQDTESANRALLVDLECLRKQSRKLTNRLKSMEQQRNDLLCFLRECNCQDLPPHRSRRTLSSEHSMKYSSPSPSRIDRRSIHQPWEFFPPHHNHQRHRLTTGEKEFYIDDELDDQPDLSACVPSVCTQPYLCTFSPNYYAQQTSCHPLLSFSGASIDCSWKLKRSYSWPNVDWRDNHGMCWNADYVWPTQRDLLSPSSNEKEQSSSSPRFQQQQDIQPDNPMLPSNGCPEDMKTLLDLLDDASFVHRLEAIYHVKSECGFLSTNHQPQYKQLFKDAFTVIRSLKSKLVQ